MVAGSLLRFDDGDDVVDRLGGEVWNGQGLPFDVGVHDTIQGDQSDDGVGVVVASAVGGDGAGVCRRDGVRTRSDEGTIHNSLANLVDE